jgi:hypothetical protein
LKTITEEYAITAMLGDSNLSATKTKKTKEDGIESTSTLIAKFGSFSIPNTLSLVLNIE